MQWDSKHYQTIATTGYTFAGEIWPNIAFFPLYPLLIRVFMPLVFGSATIAALLIANLALFVAVLLLFDLVASDFDHITAYRSVLMLLLFPTSFYLVAGYTESLALALAVAAVWAMRRERWWLAGAAGFFLALTRVPGIMIAPVLTCAYLQHHSWNWRALLRPPFLAVLLPPLGLASFMLYQWLSFDTPVAFLVAQQNWNNGMAPPWVIPEKILRAIRTSSEWEMAVVQLVVWLSVIGLTIMAIRRLPLSYGLTTLLLLLPPFLANQRGSLIRHVLIGFPIFVVLALIARRQWQRWLVFSLTLPLLVLLTLLFVNGFGLA
jgi:MFS family permease